MAKSINSQVFTPPRCQEVYLTAAEAARTSHRWTGNVSRCQFPVPNWCRCSLTFHLPKTHKKELMEPMDQRCTTHLVGVIILLSSQELAFLPMSSVSHPTFRSISTQEIDKLQRFTASFPSKTSASRVIPAIGPLTACSLHLRNTTAVQLVLLFSQKTSEMMESEAEVKATDRWVLKPKSISK